MTDSLLRHFRLSAHPFGRDAPKTALHRHRGVAEALERLRFTVEIDGIFALVAEPGCGKSLLLDQLIVARMQSPNPEESP